MSLKDEIAQCVCVDLGAQGDYTAIAEIGMQEIWDKPTHEDLQKDIRKVSYRYNVHQLRRMPLGTSYLDIVEHIKNVVRDPRFGNPYLVVDGTGVGLPVLQMMQDKGLRPVGICITAGHTVSDWYTPRRQKIGKTVPKRDIIINMKNIADNFAIRVPESLEGAKALREELLNFKYKITKNGTDTYEAWRDKIHDDLVLAVGIGLWYLVDKFKTTQEIIDNKLKLNTKDEDYDPLYD